MSDQTSIDISIETQGAITLATLARTKALNALTTAMRKSLSDGLWAAARDPQVYAVVIRSAAERAFSAGSDVREVIALARQDMAAARRAFADEYALNWQCECFSKPTVPLINGMVMGGGVGITQFGTHRIAGEGYKFAMPETAIGLFPDVGICHVFARLPGHVGQYLGLLGRSIGRADAYALGLVTHCIDARHFAEITSELAGAWPVDPLLDRLHQDPGEGELQSRAEVIEMCFSAGTVEEIALRLAAVRGAHEEWAQAALAELKTRSPLSLKITHRHIRGARSRDLRDTLVVDYRIACRMLEGHDFFEGVRAALVDKDHAPRWASAGLADVSDAMVDQYFAPLGSDELRLPSRADMQAARA